MIYFIALLVGVVVYVIANAILSGVESLKARAELLSFILGILAALVVVGAIHI